ncbi:DUF5666 domain-containing protein [Marinobacter sp. DY40_1A1]|uniref:DUF5666 domain-containing protein n=1 Tax=Marinobacter sp. DY40_1A1 TaxID=2583229 RepID=UPI001906A358|nr:DUF5666 domain-containing protein [Marinobacter sp. DY40_1A1]MBK1885140.1 hypothetical protein [Marinobacter sp. DY40_1A1]
MKLISRKRPLTALATVLLLGLFSACGGESQVADGGIRGTGSSVGPVSGFGSVFVNGVEFFTDSILNEKVESNDGIDTEGDLNEGMILRIEGQWRIDGTGAADSMEYDDTLRGDLSNLVRGAPGEPVRFEIYGQQVVADRQTVLKGRTLATLANNDFVRVSAWRQPDGRYRASYIGFNPVFYGADPIELEGPVDAGSVEADQFTMNGAVIKFGDDSFAEGISAEDLKPGAYFEVEGYKELAGGAIVATRIQLDDFRRYRPVGEDIEIAGPVSSDYNRTDNTFGLNGLTIQVTSATELDDITLDDLKAGLLVQVEGEFVSGDLVRATEIEVRDGDAEVSGTITANDVNVGQDSLTVGGVRVQITSRTIITDDSSGDRLTIYKLLGPDADHGAQFVEVEVTGLQKKDDQGAVYIEALQIERELSDEPGLEYELEGTLAALAKKDLSTSIITVLGVRIEVDSDILPYENLEEYLRENVSVLLEVEYIRNDLDQYEALSVELD